MNELAFARVEGLVGSDEEFWHLQPRQWNALVAAWRKKQQREDRRTARICATIANRHRQKSERVYAIDDFMPTLAKPRKALTPEAMKARIIDLHLALGGDMPGKERTKRRKANG